MMVTAVECQELLERHLGQADVEKATGVGVCKPSNLEADEEKGTNDTQINEDDEAIELVNES